MIPDFDPRGLLPPGIHEASLDELIRRFGGKDCRDNLLRRLRQFIETELLPWASGLCLDIAGPLLSDKPCPEDVDCTLRVPSERAPSLRDDMHRVGSRHAHSRLTAQYRVDFYITFVGYGSDFSSFFNTSEKKPAPSSTWPHPTGAES